MDGLISDFLQQAPPASQRIPHDVFYVEDFDDPSHAEGALPGDHPEIIAPGYTADDVDLAREEGRASGLEEARAEHTALQAALCNAALTAIGDALASARSSLETIAVRRAENISRAVLALLEAALPATAARLAADEIDALLAALLPPLAREPLLAIRVHPAVLASIGNHLASFNNVTVAADEAMAPSDVTVTWSDGQARRDWTTLWASITAALKPFHLPPETEISAP